MPTKISALTGYDGDQLDGPEILPIVETDESKTEGITVSQLFERAPNVPRRDANGNELLDFTSNASAVNHIDVANAASGNAPVLSAVGGDASIPFRVEAKFSGVVLEGGNAVTAAINRTNDSATALAFRHTGTREGFVGFNGSFQFRVVSDNNEILFQPNNTEEARAISGGFLFGKTSQAADPYEFNGTVRAEGGTRSASPTVSDDASTSISPDRSQVLVYVTDGSTEQALVRIDLDNADATAVDSTANIATTTGSLGGTTGTDGNLTISADAGNTEIDIENRLGGSRDLTVLIIG